MRKINWLWLSALMMFSLAACGAGSEPDDVEPTPNPNIAVTGMPGQVQEPTADDIPLPPDDKNLVRGNAYITSTELLILESFPIQVVLAITGDLPTPCESFAYSIEPPNDVNQIHVEVYSLGNSDLICVQVLQPFEENLSISNLNTPLEDGSYTVWLNGELVGEFNYPGG